MRWGPCKQTGRGSFGRRAPGRVLQLEGLFSVHWLGDGQALLKPRSLGPADPTSRGPLATRGRTGIGEHRCWRRGGDLVGWALAARQTRPQKPKGPQQARYVGQNASIGLVFTVR